MKTLVSTLSLLVLLLAPVHLLAEEVEAPTVVQAELALDSPEISTTSTELAEVDLVAQLTLAADRGLICEENCFCVQLQTPPTTRVGATCLRARQNAAAAARLLAVCPPHSNGKCGPTTHTVAPCQALATGGFSATATAFYKCEFCLNPCS